MTVPTESKPVSRDAVLAELIEKLTAKIQAGEAVDVEASAREYPELADQLRELLPALQVLAVVGQSMDAGARTNDATVPHDPVAGILGDFRILREVGRGGMGVVYEAEQISLGRRVALKVLPFAATMDPRHLLRFQNEARAAASLDHPHVVKVHAVGCDRAVHFFAMQFIDGQTLAAVIAELKKEEDSKRRLRGLSPNKSPESSPLPLQEDESRVKESDADSSSAKIRVSSTSPTAAIAELSTLRSIKPAEFFRRVAQWGIQAAEALGHAHGLGIVHRDVKPGNLMIETRSPRPASGRGDGGEGAHLWVTDFGLARMAADTGLTMTGDLVGTLRYMSPEQALGKRTIVDHHTDIYSLGATLYELLTLEPAFAGGDREELLHQIAFEEPRPPRRLNKEIPSELETIVMKALEKNPIDRYATAKELADDLERFLEDKPITARRPTLVQRARKWGRRHRATVTASAGALLVIIGVLGAAVGWLVRDQAARLARMEDQARDALREANQFRQEEKWAQALGAVKRAEAVRAECAATDEILDEARNLRKDLEMARQLEDFRLSVATWKDSWPWQEADTAYARGV